MPSKNSSIMIEVPLIIYNYLAYSLGNIDEHKVQE
jgi:hypothetical protein